MAEPILGLRAICAVDGCERRAWAREWCSMHYGRWRTHGTTDLLPNTKSNLSVGTPAKCRECDAPFLKYRAPNIFCSKRCNSRAGRRKRGRRVVGDVIGPRPCDWCTQPYMIVIRRGGKSRSKYCSVSCKNDAIHFGRQYGVTYDEWQALKALTHCELCGVAFGKGRNLPVVDHDHATGVVRGRICNGCNTLLGHLRDSPALALSAISYLTRQP